MEGKRILVVEDEGIVARDIQCRLVAMGFAATGWVTTGPDAVVAVRDDPPDLVLMDIHLKGEMDGVDTARAIQAEHDVPVVYLTAHADAATLERAMSTEPFGYVLKPFQEQELRFALEIALFKHGTERTLRRQEEDLRRVNGDLNAERAFLSALFASMPSAILVVDSGGEVRSTNASLDGDPLAGTMHVLPGDIVRCVNALDSPGSCGSLEVCTRCNVRSAITDALRGERVHRRRAEIIVRDRSGYPRSTVAMVSAAPFDRGGNRTAVAIVEDITELEVLRQLVNG